MLVVEDDPKIVEAIEKSVFLAGGSYDVKSVSQQDKALSLALRYKPDIILLDIRLAGGGDGRVVLKSLKENVATRAIPVIFLTGMSSEGDKVLGLNLGADDYVVKPFGAMELAARISAVCRRYRLEPSREKKSISGLNLDSQNRIATLNGKPLKLQPKEFEILFLLVSQPGRSLTRSYLIENSSSYGMPVSTRSLDTHIKNIRKKLGAKAVLIETVAKLGYRFAAADT